MFDSVRAMFQSLRRQFFTPDHQNLRQFMTPVDDQDSPTQCNSCTAFAVTATIEGTYNKANSASPVMLNARKLFNEAGPPLKCKASHWWPDHALAHAVSNGLEQTNFPAAPRIKIRGYQYLIGSNLNQTQKKMKVWINSTGPVVAVLVQYYDLGSTWSKDWTKTYPGSANTKVYFPGASLPASGTPGEPGAIVGGHVVSIAGYDDRSSPSFWICKNSWNNTWNGDGYVYIAQSEDRVHGAPNGNGIGTCYIDLIDVWGVVF